MHRNDDGAPADDARAPQGPRRAQPDEPDDNAPGRRTTLAMRWIIGSARTKQGRPMAEKLAQELLEASRGQGAAVKRREDLYRMAEANRAFVHYRW